MKDTTLHINDISINYISFGKGKKNLILIPGLGDGLTTVKGTSIPFSLLYQAYTKDYTVYSFSSRNEIKEGHTTKDMAMDLKKAMDALNLTSVDVVGVSQGGMIAQYLAIDRPDLVRKLVLAVTASRNNSVINESIEKWVGLTEQREWGKLVRDMAVRMYSDSYLRRYKIFMPLLAIVQKPKDPMRFSMLSKACLTCDAYDELDRIECSVLVIGGSEDKIVGEEASLEIAKKINCDIYIYKGLGHALYEEAKDFNSRVLAFFAK